MSITACFDVSDIKYFESGEEEAARCEYGVGESLRVFSNPISKKIRTPLFVGSYYSLMAEE